MTEALSNKQLSNIIKLNAQLLELHNGNEFKIKTLTNAAFRLGRIEQPLYGLLASELEKIEGIGKSIASKIAEISLTGTCVELQELFAKTPEGVIDIMNIKGIGPKKVALIWKELEVESVGELLYACKENRLVDIKGFGEKTQAEVIKAIEFFQQNSGQYHYATIAPLVIEIQTMLSKINGINSIAITGDFYRKNPTIQYLTYAVLSSNIDVLYDNLCTQFIDVEQQEDEHGYTQLSFNVGTMYVILMVSSSVSLAYNTFFNSVGFNNDGVSMLDELPLTSALQVLNSEEAIFNALNCPYIIPEARDNFHNWEEVKLTNFNELVNINDIRGILHWHTTYSDGKHNLTQMANYANELGYAYVGVCDHSQSAFYANGLKPDRTEQQHAEINALNAKYTNGFKIFKGIECDILNNGNLDYEDEVLASFDFIVASVHSNLKMNKTKATDRVLAAIHNKYTTILGHPTGRLLLSRPGYELDWEEIIKACVAQKVVLELNAHPYRLDIDWTLIHQAQKDGCLISINPDSHEMKGFHDIQYGIHTARKGLLQTKNVLNALSLQDFENYLKNKKNNL
jgi:DNA polymerase (family X)